MLTRAHLCPERQPLRASVRLNRVQARLFQPSQQAEPLKSKATERERERERKRDRARRRGRWGRGGATRAGLTRSDPLCVLAGPPRSLSDLNERRLAQDSAGTERSNRGPSERIPRGAREEERAAPPKSCRVVRGRTPLAARRARRFDAARHSTRVKGAVLEERRALGGTALAPTRRRLSLLLSLKRRAREVFGAKKSEAST